MPRRVMTYMEFLRRSRRLSQTELAMVAGLKGERLQQRISRFELIHWKQSFWKTNPLTDEQMARIRDYFGLENSEDLKRMIDVLTTEFI